MRLHRLGRLLPTARTALACSARSPTSASAQLSGGERGGGEPAAMQSPRGQWGRRQSGGGGPPAATQPCIYHLRGSCRFGSSCRFSHDTDEMTARALPLHHRQAVSASAAAAAAAAQRPPAAAAAGAAAAPWRFRVMSYNCLADCLAHEHAAELYASAPRYSLEWGYRSSLLIREILAHAPDVVCLQEVDHFGSFQAALQPHGYEGMYTRRTGDRRDGLALFWRADVLRPVKQRAIQFCQLGLKDNVAQLIAFQRCDTTCAKGSSGAGGGGSQTSSESSGGGGSLTGQKRRQGEEEAATPRSRHLRFDSDDEAESGGAGSARRRRRSGDSMGAAAAAALGAVSIEDAVEHAAAAPPGASREEAAEEATEAAAAGEGEEGGGGACMPALVVANIHVLFNPKRGDLKMGQVRTLLEHVDSLCLQQQKRSGLRAAAVVCGDFNSAEGSPIHSFVRSGALDLAQHDRRRMSGQVEAPGHNWRALQQAFLERQGQRQGSPAEGGVSWAAGEGGWPGAPPALNVDAAAAIMQQQGAAPPQVVPPYAPPYEPARGGGGRKGGGLRAWTAEDVRLAGGSSLASSRGGLVARHPLHLASAYAALTGSEATYSTCHDKFIGCVDYVWFTPSSGSGSGSGSSGSSSSGAGAWRLHPLCVLEPPPLQTLKCALPSPAWPSDHISLVADFALVPGSA